MKTAPALIAGALLLGGITTATADTLYITGRIKAGLHQSKQPDSPIVKVIPSGTAVDVVKRDDNVSFVREPDGTSGWIDNSYLVPQPPGGTPDPQAQKRLSDLRQQLESANTRVRALKAQLKTQPDNDALQALKNRNADLQQQLKAEQMKSKDLEMQLGDLRKQVGIDKDNKSLYEKIADLSSKNRQLQKQLTRAGNNPGAGGGASTAGAGPGWQRLLVYVGIALLLGTALGIYLLDVFNRRRHGGFRV